MAFGIDDAITAASSLIKDGIDKIWPNPTEEAAAKVALMKATSDAAIAQLTAANSIMLAEANSSDKWTSRARPSFMYVMYGMIIWAIPMGVLFAIDPIRASNIATGMQQWLIAIPDTLWNMFGFCFVGYSASRTFEKVKGVSK